MRALDAATGSVLWRAEGTAAAVAAGRVYANPAVLDLVTGEQVGTHPMPNTRIRLVDIPQAAAAATQAAWPYERVTDITDREIFALQGDTILTAGTELREHPGRRFALPRGTQVVDLVQATSKALMVFMVGPDFRVRYGPRNGPLRPHRRTYTVTAAITGSTLLTVERDQRWIYKRDIRGGPQRRLARVGRELSYMQVAGNYVAVQTEQRRIVVLDVRSGRRIYSVPSGGFYRLSANGRIVFGGDEFERIRTATPREPKLRTIARVRAGSFALAGDEIVFSEQLSDSTGRLVLLTPDGRQQPLTPRMRLTGDIVYDGKTLAFRAGRCVFKGPLTTATGTPPEDCYPPE